MSMFVSLCRSVRFQCAAAALVLCVNPSVHADTVSLFSSEMRAHSETAFSTRISADVFSPDAFQVGDQLMVDDVEDTGSFDGVITRVNIESNDRYVMAAANDDGERMLLAVHGDAVAGTVWTSDSVLEIRSIGRDGAVAIEVTDYADYPGCSGAPMAEGGVPAPADAFAGCSDTGATIDVLLVFTDDAVAANGGLNGIQAFADLAEESTNDAYANSNIATRLRIVGVEQLNYAESGNSGTDLDRLRVNGDGHLDDVHAMREAAGADLVSLVVANMSDACGRGYIAVTTSHTFPSYGFNVVADGCAIGNLSFAHEIGHNQGCRHDRANSPNPGAYEYSHGYRASDNSFRTVMAVASSAPRVQHFSNPGVNYGGQPTGVSASSALSAHNALSIDNVAYRVAQFRCAVEQVDCPWDCAPVGGNGEINIDDLLQLLDQWGGPGTCDVSPDHGDGTYGNDLVNVDDFVAVVSAIGSCP